MTGDVVLHPRSTADEQVVIGRAWVGVGGVQRALIYPEEFDAEVMRRLCSGIIAHDEETFATCGEVKLTAAQFHESIILIAR